MKPMKENVLCDGKEKKFKPLFFIVRILETQFLPHGSLNFSSQGVLKHTHTLIF